MLPLRLVICAAFSALGTAPAQGPVPSSSFYMGEDDLFRNPFTDGLPSRR